MGRSVNGHNNYPSKMKKIFVSVGLAAVGAAGLPTAYAQDMAAAAAPKIWNVASSLRGFYDDNYLATSKKTGSFGLELSPSVSANTDLQQTDIGVKYTFGAYYYFQRADNGLNPWDYTHQGDLWVDHAFNERFKVTVSDSLVVAQDPTLVEGGATVRANGNAFNNHSAVTLNSQWTRQFSTATYYKNDLVVYTGAGNTNNVQGGQAGYNPSNADLLNRINQSVGTDFQWQYTEQTMAFIGYAFSWNRYTGNARIEPSQFVQFPAPGKQVNYNSQNRNTRTHYLYVGVSEEFSPNLSGTARVGAYDTDNYNDPVSNYSSVSPYADINVTYTYIPGSYLQVGLTQDQNATDVAALSSSGQLTAYQNTTVLYGTINHQITPKITGSLVGQYQYSTYENGAYANSTGDSDVSAGINLSYQINRNFSANTGYNFDSLSSSISQRSNNRNRVYIGLTANY